MSTTRSHSPAETAPSLNSSAQDASQPNLSAQEPQPPKVAILLCTYNGAQYLEAQLASFESQTHANWHLWASDDGSSDETLAILRRCQQNWGPQRLTVLDGPQAGSTRNFMSLVHNNNVQADYFAFSDQDDIWENDKVERAVAWLQSQPSHLPALYCTRTRVVDEHNNAIGFSPLYTRPPSFRNALTQNIASGNTMVFNAAARSAMGEPDLKVFIHDWWAYLAVTACGGTTHYDAYPSLRYRQHQGNQIGINSTWTAVQARARRLFAGNFQASTGQNLAALQSLNHAVTPDNREILQQYAKARKQGPVARIAALKRLGLYQQTRQGNIGLVVAALFNKL